MYVRADEPCFHVDVVRAVEIAFDYRQHFRKVRNESISFFECFDILTNSFAVRTLLLISSPTDDGE